MAKKKKKRKKRRSPETTAAQPKPQPVAENKPTAKLKPAKTKVYLAAAGVLLVAALVLFVLVKRSPEEGIARDGSLNVLLVTLDTTRADRLGCYGYTRGNTPNMDSLAADGVLFTKAYCQVPLTSPSHCSIMTGTYPPFHQVRNNGTYFLSPELQTLAEVLKDREFSTAAFVSSFSVDSRFGLDQGFDVYDDQFAPDQAFKSMNSERRAEQVFTSFSHWLDENRTSRFFSWVHFFDPHVPYDPPSPFREQFAADPYDGEVSYMDHAIGQLVNKLRDLDLLKNTLIILAGDHGEAFGEKEERGHGIFLYEGTMRVPLIFYAENRLPKGTVVDSRVRLIDIMPSILDMLTIPTLAEIQGVSLIPYIEGLENGDLISYIESYYPRENYGWSELVGLIENKWKYIKAPREELYNLDLDPEERRNLALEERNVVQEMRKRLGDVIGSSTSALVARKTNLTAEERERLRSLGYIADPGGSNQGDLPDPKDRLEELRLIQEAEAFEMEERFEEAAAAYEKVLALRPDVALSYVNLALMNARLNRMEETIRVLERGVERIPDSETLLARLGHTFMAVGRLQKALGTFGRILEDNPRYFDALLGSAWILNLMNRPEECRAFYRRALDVEPENKFARKNFALSLASSGELAQAIEIYNDLVEEFPDDYEILQELGIAYGYAGDVIRSVEFLEKAVNLHPDPLGYLNLAVAMRKSGRLQEAVRYFKLYLENPEGQSEDTINRVRAELRNLEESLKR